MEIDSIYNNYNINEVIVWSEKWQMLFNLGKCKCLHTEHENDDIHYTTGGIVASGMGSRDTGASGGGTEKTSIVYT